MHAGGQGFESLILHERKIFDMMEGNKTVRDTGLYGPVRGKEEKGGWWIPRLSEARKDAVSCEKPRGGANAL